MIKKGLLNAYDILDNISQSVIIIDFDGIVKYWNRASERIFGYSREEMLHQSIAKVYPSIAHEKLQADLETIRKGNVIEGQWKSITKDGTIRWIEIDARPIKIELEDDPAIIVSAYDIQHLKDIEKELEERKAQAHAILETTVDGIITVGAEGSIRSFNSAASRIFGYSKDEVIGKSVRMLVAGGPDQNKHEFKRCNVKPDSNNTHREMTGVRKDGSHFPMELSVSEVTWNGEQLFTSVINDITERRRLEQEILKISEQERRSIGQDLHDGLGQMLTGIGLICQDLARRLQGSNAEEAEDAKEISELIKEADEYAKALAHGLVHVDVEQEGLHKALVRLSEQAKKFFKVNCSFQSDFNSSVHNPLKALNLYRIAQEAISNAVKHGKANNIDIRLSADNGFIKLDVIDDGVGFSKAQNIKENKGMGIHIMEYRANTMSGRLDIQQTDGHTKVTCHVPAV